MPLSSSVGLGCCSCVYDAMILKEMHARRIKQKF